MAGYRPLSDTFIGARPKVKYYGAFPAGFLSRARALLGVTPSDGVLHVCGGRVRDYPFAGFGAFDKTVDLDPELQPDFVMDVRHELPAGPLGGKWAGILIDRPYTEADAAKYRVGADKLPNLNDLTRRCLELVPVGHRVGVLDYLWPHPGANGKEVALLTVTCGRNSRVRLFTVFERVNDGEGVSSGRAARARRAGRPVPASGSGPGPARDQRAVDGDGGMSELPFVPSDDVRGNP